jgi:hypothetical protein
MQRCDFLKHTGAAAPTFAQSTAPSTLVNAGDRAVAEWVATVGVSKLRHVG